jgi:Domain of unknown function (DUF4396)
VFAVGWELLGLALPAEYIADFALALAIGIAFQYFSIAPMHDLGTGEGILAALKADTLSLTAFEIGPFGWMAIMRACLPASTHAVDQPRRISRATAAIISSVRSS